ncbi:MAG TPA: hypothetical protein VJQ57_09430 [Acidimicrobiia bacterium]|nr:hypothetical protein [Acidimicrobiia bacterium]
MPDFNKGDFFLSFKQNGFDDEARVVLGPFASVEDAAKQIPSDALGVAIREQFRLDFGSASEAP